MKNILALIFTISLHTFVLSQATGTLQPMLEEFTQASCGPCASQNPAFNALIAANQGQNGFITNSLKYQVAWPGTDPMYNQNEEEVDARVSYYAVSGVPFAKMNGVSVSGPNYMGAPANLTQSTLAATAATAAPIEVDVVWDWANNSLNTINLTVTVTNTNGGVDFTSADKVHIVIVEEEINFTSAPGSNGEKDFYMVMRDMLPDNNGNALSTVTAATPLVFTFNNQPVPANFYDISQLGVVAFVQNNSTKQIYNSDYQANPGFPPGAGSTPADMTISTVVAPLSNYCDANFIPEATITNSNSFALDSFAVSYVLDGASPVTQVITLPLSPGASNTVTFPSVTVNNNSKFIYYYDINSYSSTYIDLNSLNNIAENNGPFPLLSTFVAVGTSISTNFDGLALGTAAPANAIADNQDDVPAYSVDNTVSASVTWNLGGHGNSNGCFLWDFFATPGGRKSSIVYEKIDFSAVPTNATAEIKWTHAYAQRYFFSNDALEVKASTDCGATWTSLWNKVGSQLSTATAVTSARYYPAINEWVDNVVDISAFIGQPEVLIAFEGLSANGNDLYVDDINTEITIGVPTNEIDNSIVDFRVYPNPVHNIMTIEFDVDKRSNMTLFVVNTLGQTVLSVPSNYLADDNKLIINTSDLSAGVYFINAVLNDTVFTKRFIIER